MLGAGLSVSSFESRTFDPHDIVGLYEWWSSWYVPANLKQLITGTTAVAANNDKVGWWKGSVNSTVAVTADNVTCPLYKTTGIGAKPAIAFAGGADGMLGTMVKTFAGDFTLIIIAKRTGNIAFRSLFSMAENGATNGNASVNGCGVDAGAAGTGLRFGTNNVFPTEVAVVNNAPTFIVCKIRPNSNSVHLAGFTDSEGFVSISVNGGYPQAYNWNASVADITTGVVALGGRSDSVFGSVDYITDIFLIDGNVTPTQEQRMIDGWLIPQFGAGVF